jgi:hypothetical protein
MNALITTATAPFPAPQREAARRDRHPPTPCPRVLCRHCRHLIMVVTAPSGVLRLDPDPTEHGNLVVNGARLIMVLPQRNLQSGAWAGWAYREHRCAG